MKGVFGSISVYFSPMAVLNCLKSFPNKIPFNGQNVKDAFSSEIGGNEETKANCNTPNHHKEIKWNLRPVRPEVLKCYRSIVNGLNRAGPQGNTSDEKETVPLQQNDLTAREQKNESAHAPKRKLDLDSVKNCVKESTSAACVLSTSYSTFLTISHDKLEPSKGKTAEGKKVMI